jgi:hypothetical protein
VDASESLVTEGIVPMGNKGTCKAEGCEKDVHGKGYCERHYRAWRRGKMGKARYTPCHTDGCTKPAVRRSLCPVHFESTHGKGAAQAEKPETPSSGDAQGGEKTEEAAEASA